jgi:hypothetical protein
MARHFRETIQITHPRLSKFRSPRCRAEVLLALVINAAGVWLGSGPGGAKSAGRRCDALGCQHPGNCPARWFRAERMATILGT